MQSKVCLSCGAKNPSTVYSCTNCAASLVDVVPDTHIPLSTSTSGNTSISTMAATTSTNKFFPVSNPVAVVKRSYIKDIIYSIIPTASGLFSFVLSSGEGSSYTGFSLFFLIVTILIPVALAFERSKFEFYGTYFLVISRRKTEQIEYSEIQSVHEKWSVIRIKLKRHLSKWEIFRRRVIIAQGNPRVIGGLYLAAWLQRKVTESTKSA